MKQDIVQVNSAFRVNGYDKMRIPADVLKNRINNELSHNIADYILENMDKMPAEIETKQFIEQDSEEYILRLNIISDAEIKRLKQIEYLYESKHGRLVTPSII
jgi:hypothetical protein